MVLEGVLVEFNVILVHVQMKLRLSTKENELLLLHSCIYIVSCLVGFGAYVAGLFAMNTQNNFQDVQTSSLIVVVITLGIICVGFMMIYKYFEVREVYQKRVSFT